MASTCATLMMLSLALSSAWGQGTPTTAPANSPNAQTSGTEASAATQNTNPDNGPNNMTRVAVQRGILQCAARIEQVTKFLGFGPQAGAFLIPPPQPADRHLFSMQLEVPAGASFNSFVDMDFAPGQANGCGSAYQAVSYWAVSCDQVASKQFAQLKRLPPLKRDVAVLDGGPFTKVFLMRAGDSGCVSIKKEIVF